LNAAGRLLLIQALLLVLALSACGSRGPDIGQSAPLECVPFARALSGIHLRGDAADWWWQASNYYARGRVPEIGSVLVFASTRTLPVGHLSVVSQVRSRREILVTQANWVHHRVTTDQLVVDVSPYGDWSAVRVWWPPAGALGGTVYPVLGFIYSGNPTSHARIVGNVSGAVRTALGD
jgi:surface antigen